jgi:hypothetical protein
MSEIGPSRRGVIMGESRRIAVLLVRHDLSQLPPPVAVCRDLLSSGGWSVARYWTENSERWFQFAAFDYFGWYDVQLPAPPSARATVRDAARGAASAAGVDLNAYDSFIVMTFPGAALVPNPKFGAPKEPAQIAVGYDAGSDGIGPGHTAVLNVTDSRTVMCHELGHVLGFDHTYGIPTNAADWSNDGITQLYPVYGDPYDLMSAGRFGDSNPTLTLPAAEIHTGFPGALVVGPMLSRAVLHYTSPSAMEAVGKVRHDYEGGTNQLVDLYPAGSGVAGKAEVFVYHPLGEDGAGRGRVYVEYRQPNSLFFQTRWDGGLESNGDDLAHPGIIVHVIKSDPTTGTPVVWYVGRITLPNADTDVQVDTPFGPVTVSVAAGSAHQLHPLWVSVRISKGVVRPRLLLEAPPPTDEVVILWSEKRTIPGWELLGGAFTWERRSRTRTARYIASTVGLGAGGSTKATKTVTLRWFIGNEMCMNAVGTIALMPVGGGKFVHVHYELDEVAGILTLKNDPTEGAYRVGLHVEAYDLGWQLTASANADFDAPGIEEGWGDDYKHFMSWLYHMTHPIPKWRPGPPRVGDVREQIEEMSRILDEISLVNATAARALRPMQSEFARSQLSANPKLALEPRSMPAQLPGTRSRQTG